MDDLENISDWCSSDLRTTSLGKGVQLDSSFVQPCIEGVMMGDLNAVTAVQEAHSRLLLNYGILTMDSMVSGTPEFPSEQAFRTGVSDVYIDDLVLLCPGTGMHCPAPLCETG